MSTDHAATAEGAGAPDVLLREPREDEAELLGRIAFNAFHAVAQRHCLPLEFPTVEAATALIAMCIAHPGFWGVVAEREGTAIGSNFLDERDPVRGVGPVTVDPHAQVSGIGRLLMQAVLHRAKGAPSVRLLQDAANPVSLSLYASLGFDVKELVVRITGRPRSAPPPGLTVRPMQESDVPAAERLALDVHGYPRSGAVRDALEVFQPFVAERSGEIVAYVTTTSFYPASHAAARTSRDLLGLLLGAASKVSEPLDLLLPVRQADLYRALLREGLRVVKPLTLMASGDYQHPRGAWLPSVLY